VAKWAVAGDPSRPVIRCSTPTGALPRSRELAAVRVEPSDPAAPRILSHRWPPTALLGHLRAPAPVAAACASLAWHKLAAWVAGAHRVVVGVSSGCSWQRAQRRWSGFMAVAPRPGHCPVVRSECRAPIATAHGTVSAPAQLRHRDGDRRPSLRPAWPRGAPRHNRTARRKPHVHRWKRSGGIRRC
jgi:hypothetical protein